MRLDKFLKVSRIIKRRTVAKEFCGAGRALINGRPAKAGAEVKVGDNVSVRFGNKEIEFEIINIAESIKATDASSLYKIITEKYHNDSPAQEI